MKARASRDRKSTRLNSSHSQISYAVFCLKKKLAVVSMTEYPNSLQSLALRCLMLYELRRYDVAPTKLPALLDRFGSFTVHKWKEYGFRLIGFWTPLVGEKSNQIVYMWGWESLEERAKKNAAWRADPERAKKWADRKSTRLNSSHSQISYA